MMNENPSPLIPELKEHFQKRYQKPAERFFFCPGRINLIGEHTDYNGGKVMPCALSIGTYLALSNNEDHVFRIASTGHQKSLLWPVNEMYKKKEDAWYNYPMGLITYMIERPVVLPPTGLTGTGDHRPIRSETLNPMPLPSTGKAANQLDPARDSSVSLYEKREATPHGIDFLFMGNMPIGSGLSSSASLEVLTGFAVNEVFQQNRSLLDLVLMAQRLENEFMGLASGIMDPFAVAFSVKDHAMVLDCLRLRFERVPLHFPRHEWVLIHTNKPRQLIESAYNTRVHECQRALASLQIKLPIATLCELNESIFNAHQGLILDPVDCKRARHVVTENARVEQAAKALASQDLITFGRLLTASHHSLKTLYEVSGPELDSLVDFATAQDYVLGARMTGAGFGGCAIALLEKGFFEPFKQGIELDFQSKMGYLPSVSRVETGNGVMELMP